MERGREMLHKMCLQIRILLAPQAPPPGCDQQLWSWFKAVDTDNSGHLSADELQKALINGDWSPFNIETVRLMVNMFDSGIYKRKERLYVY